MVWATASDAAAGQEAAKAEAAAKAPTSPAPAPAAVEESKAESAAPAPASAPAKDTEKGSTGQDGSGAGEVTATRLPVKPGTDVELAPAISDPTKELKAADRIRFRLAEDPVKSSAPLVVVVNSVGEASFPVTRDSDLRLTLSVRGRTLGQVREELSRKLLADYYHRATVELEVEEKVGVAGKAVFFGEMKGTVPLTADQPIKLSEAVLQLAAPESARLSKVRVHRVDPATGQSKVIEVDVDAINKKGQRDKDIVLQDGDRIEVRQRWFN